MLRVALHLQVRFKPFFLRLTVEDQHYPFHPSVNIWVVSFPKFTLVPVPDFTDLCELAQLVMDSKLDLHELVEEYLRTELMCSMYSCGYLSPSRLLRLRKLAGWEGFVSC